MWVRCEPCPLFIRLPDSVDYFAEDPVKFLSMEEVVVVIPSFNACTLA